jgi:polyphosphate kinase
MPGVSERIRVTSIVDRYLEHTRIWYFEAGGKKDVWLASADWMPRNFIRRVEVAFPVEDPALRERLVDEILGTQLSDNVKARVLKPDGTYERLPPHVPAVRSQERFMALARRLSAAQEQPPVATNEMFPSTPRRAERRRKKRL